jgi:tetratricopeptide (TPR) repeat protein
MVDRENYFRQYCSCIHMVLTLVLCIAVAHIGHGQKSGAENLADSRYANKHFREAIPAYEEVIKSNPKNVSAILKLADCYQKTNNFSKAESLYSKVAHSPNPPNEALLDYAKILLQNKKRLEAMEWYQQYLKGKPSDSSSESEEEFKALSRLVNSTEVQGKRKKSGMEKMADKRYENMHYAAAIPVYEEVIRQEPENIEAIEKLAYCYKLMNNARMAEGYFAQVAMKSDAKPTSFLRYAQVLSQNEKYLESQKWYAQYLLARRSDVSADNNMTSLSKLPSLFGDSSQVSVQSLLINTRYEDFSPTFYKNGIVFASGRPSTGAKKYIFGWNNGAFLDLYYTSNPDLKVLTTAIGKKSRANERAIRQSSAMRLQGDVNSVYHEGPATFSASGDKMFFTRNNYNQKKFKTDNQGISRLKIYQAKSEGNQWSDIQDLPINSDHYSVGHPALSPDESILYFTSDMPGGYGETDIWKVAIENGKFGQPVNLGAQVNTEGKEMFPYVSKDGNLFFASDGLGGLGGLDIFYTTMVDGQFVAPQNLGAPINSSKDDFGLIVKDGNTSGYFSSFRNGQESEDDIFSFISSKPIDRSFLLTGLVLETPSRELVKDAVVILSDKDGYELKRQTSVEGSFTFEVEKDNAYTVLASKNGYISLPKGISTKDMTSGQPIEVLLELQRSGAYGLYGLITDRKLGAPMDSVRVTITDMRSGKDVLTLTTSASGDFQHQLSGLKRGDAINYLIKLERKGYLAKESTFKYLFVEPGVVPMHESMDFTLEKLEVGEDIGRLLKLNPIYFDVNQSSIRPDAALELDKIVKVMLENPEMKIELGSHTDSRGSDAMNAALSEKRAKASASYIVSKGISSNRITGKGYGEAKLVNNCANGVNCSEVEHQLNRRTEFIIVSLGRK